MIYRRLLKKEEHNYKRTTKEKTDEQDGTVW